MPRREKGREGMRSIRANKEQVGANSKNITDERKPRKWL